MKSNIRRALSLVMAAIMLLSLAGCTGSEGPNGNGGTNDSGQNTAPGIRSSVVTDLMKDIKPSKPAEDPDAIRKNVSKAADFAIRLLKASRTEEGQNLLISPLSVLYALAMTANGAEKNTLAQMEEVLGMSRSELNSFVLSYSKCLPQADEYKLKLANSIWFTDHQRFTVNNDFLQKVADYYDAEIYKTSFDDKNAAKNTINKWVEEHTDGMIPEIIDDIPDSIIMYLINALAFKAQWQEEYTPDMVQDGTFTQEDGQTQDAKLMYSTENNFINTDKATGFIKPYKDGKYAFAALLPNEGVTVSELVESLDGETISKLLAYPQDTEVQAAIPKFEAGSFMQMSEILKGMGMPDAFDADLADLSGLGTSTGGNLFISRVLHKTYISVDEKGTKAGASTAVEVVDRAIFEPLQVILDKPFVYMLVDCTTNIPFFIGTMESLGQ